MRNELQKRVFSSIILIPLSIFFIIKGSIIFIFFLSFFFLVSSFEWIKICKKNEIIKFFGILFLFISFCSAFYMREKIGLNFFLFVILICISTDIGGYVFGKILKGPKLTKISPNKTYSGVVGSFIFSILAGIVFLQYLRNQIPIDDNMILILSLILSISFISQIGDLIVSYFKRKAKIKNTGKILPGHGGLLDRIDGLIFVIPIINLLYVIYI